MSGKENVETMPSATEEEQITAQTAGPEDDPPEGTPAGTPPAGYPAPDEPPKTDPDPGEPPEEDPSNPEPPRDEPPSDDPLLPDDAPVEEPPAEDASAAGAIPNELVAEEAEQTPAPVLESENQKRAVIEAIVYITEEPLTAEQIAAAMGEPVEFVGKVLEELVREYSQSHRGLTVRELAGGYKMATKPEHHEAVRTFVRNLKPPLKLSLAALETLAVIAYKQPITGPEIMEIRGVQGAGVMKTLLDRKLITTAGRKNVVGKPMLYKTTKEFLIQFGLSGLAELPTLKEFEELRRLALTEPEPEILPESLPPEAEEGIPQAGNAEEEAAAVEQADLDAR